MQSPSEQDTLDVLVVGAGFAGVYGVYRARESGLTVRGIEAGSDVGGAWYWNRYPGARCDIESLDYSYSFSEEIQREWRWAERYSAQRQIQAYLRFVAERIDVLRDISFDTRATSARFDEASGTWSVGLSTGEEVRARYVLWATGPLTVPLLPDIPGLDGFGGRLLHSARWPDEPVDFTGRRVAVVGTGSSGIQIVPVVAQEAEHLFVCQRTANFTIPAHNFVYDDERWQYEQERYPERRQLSWIAAAATPNVAPTLNTFDVDEVTREEMFERAWQVGGARFQRVFADQITDVAANAESVAFVHRKIDELVDDPRVAELLKPKDHPLGSRRICVDTDYYVTFNRPNVTLLDVRTDPITEITATGIVVAGEEIAVDDIILATGFDAVTGALAAIDPIGRDGIRLSDAWEAGPSTFLGMAAPGFPSMFVLNGPGSPSVFASMVATSEQQVDWLVRLLTWADGRVVEATAEAADEWDERVATVAEPLLANGVQSWYLGSNMPGKPRVFLPYAGGFDDYRRRCEAVAYQRYPGFAAVEAGS